MPRVAKVGDGWSGLEDYLTLALWVSGEFGVDYGDVVEATCKGYLGAAADITGTSVNGSKIYADGVVYDGTNELLLPIADRLKVSTSSMVTLDNILVRTTNQYVSAFTLATDTLTSTGCVFDNQTAGVNAIVISGYYPNSNINNFIARGGLDVISAGYNRGTNFNKGLIYGATGLGVNASAGAGYLILNDVFSFNNGTDFDVGQLTLNNCASSDATGSSGLTGYTSVELVNFSGLDFRIKTASDLATSGSVDFTGAFLESGGVQLDPINLLQVGANPVLDVKYSVDGVSLSDVELRVGNTVVWRI